MSISKTNLEEILKRLDPTLTQMLNSIRIPFRLGKGGDHAKQDLFSR
jgi:hypothetical protein